jgi:hypothetical protein
MIQESEEEDYPEDDYESDRGEVNTEMDKIQKKHQN